ncbi:MAG: VanZ family protein [Coriobacteriia bacterium]|nr:VanZ family protein [Coriobacteriia bacterium]
MDRPRVHTFAALRFAPAAVWAGVIFAGSSIPGSRLPGGYSVVGHLGEYAILGTLLVLALDHESVTPRAAFTALLICGAYAVSDEYHQTFVPLRTADPLDWATDVIGSAVGICAALFGVAVRNRRREHTRRPPDPDAR